MRESRALITGSAKRVGRAIALELAANGYAVAVHCRHSTREADEVVAAIRNAGGRSVCVSGDLNVPANWPRIVEEAASGLGGLDILVNNASLFLTPQPDTMENFSTAQWEEMLRVNLTAPAALAHHARTHLLKGGRGRILNLTDISALRPWKNHVAYCVSKAGLDTLTRALALALAPDITVNAIALGIAVFPEAYSAQLRESITRRVPMQRESSPEEVARFVRRILESDNYLTGQVIAFDGGRGVA